MKGLYHNKIGQILITVFMCIFILSINSTKVFGQNSTQSGNSIRDKVREKIEQVKSKPKALIGTVTDKTEDTIELKDKTGEILLISVKTDEVSFIKIGKSSQSVKFSDVAIGDFIIAMGFQNGNKVLSAKRILLTAPLEDPTRVIIFGKVSKINKKIVTVTKNDGTQIDVEFGIRWKGPEIKELSTESTILVVGDQDSGKIKVRTLYTVSEKGKLSPTPTPK